MHQGFLMRPSPAPHLIGAPGSLGQQLSSLVSDRPPAPGIRLHANENPLGCSPAAKEALREALSDTHLYPDPLGRSLRLALSSASGARPSSIILGNGSNEVIDLMVRAFCAAGDSVVVPRWSFIAYANSARAQGARLIETRCRDDFSIDLEDLARAIRQDSKARIVFIANPNNPTGTCLGRDELIPFLDSMSGSPIPIVLDYAYWEYVAASDVPAPAELLERFANVVVLRTFSKAYGLAGLRIGYGMASEEIADIVDRVRAPFNVNRLALAAAQASLQDDGFLRKSFEHNRRSMELWAKALGEHGVRVLPSQGNFLMVDLSGRSVDGRQFQELCSEHGLTVMSLGGYGLHQAIRFSMGTDKGNRQAIRIVSSVLKREKLSKTA